jgi:hypothetical protein
LHKEVDMKRYHMFALLFAIVLALLVGPRVQAQSDVPNVQVAGTGIVDGTVTIIEATVPGPGWVVIHADNDGKPGAVIGYAPLDAGVNSNVVVDVDTDAATPVLHAMLHSDEGDVGTFEFPGPDAPLMDNGSIVMARFSAVPVVEAESDMAAPTDMPVTGAAAPLMPALAIAAAVLAILTVGTAVSRRRGSTEA